MRYWEIIADNLSKAGWSWGCMSAVGSRRRTIFVADATSRRFALAANCLDRLARFFQNSMPSTGPAILETT